MYLYMFVCACALNAYIHGEREGERERDRAEFATLIAQAPRRLRGCDEEEGNLFPPAAECTKVNRIQHKIMCHDRVPFTKTSDTAQGKTL